MIEAYYDMFTDLNLGTALRIYLSDKVPAGQFVNITV
jgi:hypothetical protein